MKIKTVMVGVGLMAALIFNPFSVYQVQGDSMSPTIENGEFILTVGRGASVKEGDEIEFRHGMLFRNGDRVVEEYCSGNCEDYFCVVPDGKVFVVGDNRENSLDSRNFGCVKVEAIKRVVVGV